MIGLLVTLIVIGFSATRSNDGSAGASTSTTTVTGTPSSTTTTTLGQPVNNSSTFAPPGRGCHFDRGVVTSPTTTKIWLLGM